MGTSDGTVLGKTKIAGSGPAGDRYNVVLLSDGYRSTELGQYATDAQNFADLLLANPPFFDMRILNYSYSDAINIWRVDVRFDQ